VTFAWEAAPAARARLRELVAASAGGPPDTADWLDLPARIRQRFPSGVTAIIGYGSWYTAGLRKPSSFPDVYVVVDDYRGFHPSAFHAWWNRVLPPNVYFVWSDGDGRRALRGKYNVISAADLARECSPALRDVYNAGRLTKRVWIAWTRDEAARAGVIDALLGAHRTLAPAALALQPQRFTLAAFSRELLALSYRGEARLEGWERIRLLHDAHRAHYDTLHRALLEAFAEATGLVEAAASEYRKVADPRWDDLDRRTRRLLRRSRRRGYVRWPRIVLTEPNLLDLAVNEAERKAGVLVRVTPRLRRHPLLFGLPEFLRVLRERSARERIHPS
jgi:hypothetical protein